MEIEQYRTLIYEEIKKNITSSHSKKEGEDYKSFPLVYGHDPNLLGNWIVRNLYQDSRLEELSEEQAREGIRGFVEGLKFGSWKKIFDESKGDIDFGGAFDFQKRNPPFQIPPEEWWGY